jgi:hypothetical protein
MSGILAVVLARSAAAESVGHSYLRGIHAMAGYGWQAMFQRRSGR